ncbi:MAG TPA: ATP-binding protein, partial [Albitalea sp.]|nr:ATP-binding protein [Albitalea sp.]
VVRVDTLHRRREGSPVDVQMTIAWLPDVRFFTVFVRDDSARVARRHGEAVVRAAEVALRANAAKTEFLSRMSHELRTPLNAVLGYAQLLRIDKSRPLPAMQAQWVAMIEQAGGHLLALINDVLDLSRIEAGHLLLSPEEVELRAVAHESIAMVQGLASDAGIALRVDKPEPHSPQRAFADRVRLKQVLINLLSNAIKYNHPGGTVRLGWRRLAEEWELRISDSGRGMSPAQLAHLFEPFNRLGAEHSGVEGTGIGLALSRHLVDLMGGRLHVESTVGVGTVVTLMLPVSAVEPDADIERHAELSRPIELGKLRVLYAEDNEVNVELVRQILRTRPGIELCVAISGAQALDMARSDPPDLMLLDMHLGDMTGLDVARALRADARTRGIRLVALSADALPEHIRAALAQGFEAYLTKPIDFKLLLRLLDEVAGS